MGLTLAISEQGDRSGSVVEDDEDVQLEAEKRVRGNAGSSTPRR